MKEIVTIENVSFNYHNRAVFKDFNLSIQEGDFLCVLGESGSGKSTLLGLILGLLKPSLGSVKIFNETLSNNAFLRQKIGYIAQGNSLFSHLNAMQNMTFCLNLQGMEKEASQKEAKALALKMGLDESLMDKFPNELSGGQAQRVGIIRGIIHRPELILLDEPFSALDSFNRKNLQDLIKEIHQNSHATFIMVTHDESEVQKLATKTLEIKALK
ncbi:ATP-binding cassette domain-containing protein [Helicobacter pylori]|uniref:ergothioneine transport ATP-binding protein EgtV n=1 Tax=Helicobacter pylori TaxID=210 RepID=UPI0018D1D1EB|nr:ATP-binding cassette domain-containing protein [Helicobacter pylori]MBH0278254.1 ATP-binding cassette domain-containing protein [Helicobacter pylori]MBH0281424.1 ATP-binding cassette domain-containing protein [Helicobacter pylori]MBH0283848.1 ATP-binding cassette domain-containing protein [Helicobacter pylori]